MLPEARVYMKSYVGQTKWMYFLIKDKNLLKNIMLFVIKSALILTKIDIEPVYSKNFRKSK